MASQDQSPDGPYHPGPGLGHELGVMFGFMAAFALTMGGYLVIWKSTPSLLSLLSHIISPSSHLPSPHYYHHHHRSQDLTCDGTASFPFYPFLSRSALIRKFRTTLANMRVILVQNRKSLSRELSRREALTARGYGPNEKARSSIAYGDPLYEDDNNNNNTHLHDRDEEGIAPPAAAEVHGQTAPKGELDGLNTEKKAVAGEMSAEREPVEVEAVR